MSNEDGVWTLLDTLDSSFAASLPDLPEAARSLLQPLDDARSALRRPGRRITVFGAFKTGKSSLINALAGAPILPVHARRGTGAVSRVRYGTAFRVEAQGKEVLPAGLVDLLLLGENGEPRGEATIEAPLPLLDGLWDLVDTPGLFRNEALTAASMRELEHTDLALLVLAADQVLSAQERAIAGHIGRLLHGNLIYTVNRIDLIDASEREDVLGWVTHAVQSSGNSLVGRPRILPTTARSGAEDGIDALRSHLLQICATEVGERVALLSRLGRLGAALDTIAGELDGVEGRQAASLEAARAAARVAVDEERRRIRQRIGQGRRRLTGVREDLPGLTEAFVRQCIEDTWQALQSARTGELVLNPALAGYRQAVSDRVLDAVLELPVTAPSWHLSTWLVRARVEAAGHPTIDIGTALGDLATRVLDGGQRGREAGAALGGWLGKTVFGVDVEAETRKRLERAARALLPALRQETEEYIEHVDELLAAAEGYYAEWTHSSPQVAALEREVEVYERLKAWLNELQERVRQVSGQVEDMPHDL